MQPQQIAPTGYLRLDQIIGNNKQNIPALIPISRSSWLAGVKEGKFPQPVKLTQRTLGWRVEEILQLIEDLQEKSGGE